MLKLLEKQSYLVILLVAGILLIIVSFFDIKDFTKFQIENRDNFIWELILIGVLLTAVSLFFYAQDRLTLGWFQSAAVHQIGDQLQAKCRHTCINVVFGQIQDIANRLPTSMVVLPANEYFDDECINDTMSALGSYICSVFPNQTDKVQELIKDELKKSDFEKVEKEAGVFQESYGIGSGIFLKSPLHSKQPLLFLAVTTKRSREGLRSEMSYIFEAVKKIQQVAVDNRISSICIPVMGTGHGGLPKAVGLFTLVLAICDGAYKPYGHHITEYNVVVFRPNQSTSPAISINNSKRILKTAIGLFS